MKGIIYILLFTMFFFIIGCEKDIVIDLDDQPERLVMYSFIYPDSALNLHLSKSRSILSVPSYSRVENARFRIFINEQNQGTYLLPSDTVWSTWKEFVFKEGDKIAIEAFGSDGDTVRINSYLPLKVPIDRLDTSRVFFNYGEGGEEQYLKAKVTFTDPAAEVDYYQLLVVREGWGELGGGPYYTREVVELKKEDPVFIQKDQSGSLLQGIDFQGLFSDDIINGHTYTLTVNIPVDYLFFDYYEDKIKISVYLYHHTSDYYLYFRSKILSAGFEGFYEGLPIFDPVRIYNNVEGGLGLVSGMSFDVDSIVLQQ